MDSRCIISRLPYPRLGTRVREIVSLLAVFIRRAVTAT